jgi:hypothetical protein
MVRKPLVPPAKDITASKESIYSDEKQSKFLEADTLAFPIEAENAYSLDRSTPLSALKHMMREYYSPNTLLDNSVASAIVLAVDVQAPSFYETVEGYVPSDKTEMLRIRVLSDPRNYWLPVPKSEDDPGISLHPLVRKPSAFKNICVGDIIKVNFYNNKSQFSSITDIGEVTSVISRVERPFDSPYWKMPKGTQLPALVPLDAIPTPPPPEIDLKDTSAGKKGQALVNDESFNKKVAKIAKRLGVPKADLLQIFAFETGGTMDPAEVNFIGATGLIQFTVATAIDLKTTTKKLAKMSGTKQLDYVEEYFNMKLRHLKTKKRPKNIADLYLLVIYPVAFTKKDDWIIGTDRGNTKWRLWWKWKIHKRGRNKGKKYKVPRFTTKERAGKTRKYKFPRVFAIQNSIFFKGFTAQKKAKNTANIKAASDIVVTRKMIRTRIREWNGGKQKFKDPYKDIYK